MGQAALKLQEVPRANISQLAEDFELDRASVRKRIQEAGIEPVEERAKEKIYEVSPRLAAILSDVKSPLSEAKLRRETAEAEIRELKLAEMRGEMVPMAEVVERFQQGFVRFYKEFALHQPKRLAARLAKTKTAVEASRLLKTDTEKIFARWKEDDDLFELK